MRREPEQGDEGQGRGPERKRRRLQSLTDAQGADRRSSREEWECPAQPLSS